MNIANGDAKPVNGWGKCRFGFRFELGNWPDPDQRSSCTGYRGCYAVRAARQGMESIQPRRCHAMVLPADTTTRRHRRHARQRQRRKQGSQDDQQHRNGDPPPHRYADFSTQPIRGVDEQQLAIRHAVMGLVGRLLATALDIEILIREMDPGPGTVGGHLDSPEKRLTLLLHLCDKFFLAAAKT